MKTNETSAGELISLEEADEMLTQSNEPAETDESVTTPDQDVVDEIGEAVGVTYHEGEPLRVGEKEEQRDEHRWELDPASAEDYVERSHEPLQEAEAIRHMQHQHREKGA